MEKAKTLRINESFDVVCVIGTVHLNAHSGFVNPNHAAMMLIAEHDAPGFYSFPMEDGRTQTVTVEYSEREGEREPAA